MWNNKVLLSLLAALLLSGCASHYGAATIVTEPAGAKVIDADNNQVIGTTPLTTFWKDTSATRQYVALRIEKAGFEPEISAFWVKMRHKSEAAAKKAPEKVELVLTEKE